MKEELAVKLGSLASWLPSSEKWSSSKNSRDSYSDVRVVLFIAWSFSNGLNSSFSSSFFFASSFSYSSFFYYSYLAFSFSISSY